MDVIEKYGTDALRWFLSNGSAPGQDVRFSYDKMDAAWNFINKIWNVSRYILMNSASDMSEGDQIEVSADQPKVSIQFSADTVSENLQKVSDRTAGNVTDRWILTRLNDTIARVTTQMDKFEFGVAGSILYNFIWDEFANWYLELTKEVMFGDDEAEKDVTRSVLLHVLDQVLRLLHPIMPFFTEEIFEKMPNTTGSIVVADYPTVRPEFNDEKASDGVGMLIELITAVRNARAEVNTPLSKEIPIFIKSDKVDFLNSVSPYIRRFANPSALTIAKEVNLAEQAMSAVITGAEIYLPLAGLINIDEELARLTKELAKWQKELDLVNRKLGNEKFVANAKPEVVDAERAKLAGYQEKFDATQKRIGELKK
jgi:valyl-tRNA synthetase